MKKNFWKIEYSYTLVVIFAVFLFMIPTSFSSKNARYITRWNEVYNKLDYLFSAMHAQANSDIIFGLKKAKTSAQREYYIIQLAKYYLNLHNADKIKRSYKSLYMNGIKISKGEDYYFENYYTHESGVIVGIKSVKNTDNRLPAFVMSVDLNGIKGPNTWGKDIYGINIFIDGKITPLGYGKDPEFLKNDCSDKGTGVSCSYYYRIGGNFVE